MNLLPNWRRVLRHAWSIRLLIVAGLLSGVEVALPLLDGVLELIDDQPGASGLPDELRRLATLKAAWIAEFGARPAT